VLLRWRHRPVTHAHANFITGVFLPFSIGLPEKTMRDGCFSAGLMLDSSNAWHSLCFGVDETFIHAGQKMGNTMGKYQETAICRACRQAGQGVIA
jgi:hypothetical protein